MAVKLTKATVPYGNTTRFNTYIDQDDNHYQAEPIGQHILLETGSIENGSSFTFSLENYASAIQPLSLFVAADSEREEDIKIEVNSLVESQKKKVFFLDLRRHQIPYIFPPILLFPTTEIILKPRFDIFNCYILAKPSNLLYHDKIFERIENGHT
ncbi:MAG: hypothetical protein AB4372_40680 [Xenococcus sp. (in: cyanobacteria)]